MTITEALARYGVQAAVTPAGTGVRGPALVGIDRETQREWSDANIAYALKVSGALGDQATLALDTGVATATLGSPTITDGDGKDLEGVTLPTLATLYGLQLVAAAANTFYVTCTLAPSFLPSVDQLTAGDVATIVSASGVNIAAAGSKQLVVDFAGTVDELEIVVIGKS